MRRQNTRAIGARYEEKAAAYLSAAGIEILAKNFYCRGGEIDLIGSDGQYLIFFEVKYRRSGKDGLPFSAIGGVKRRRIFLAARQYLYLQQLPENTPLRFDAIGILGEEIIWLKDAFRETRI
ncbi:YraN family protein [Stomatobaculum sp.]